MIIKNEGIFLGGLIGVFSKLKKEFVALTDKGKSNFETMMIEALSCIPIVGQGVNFFKSLAEWNEYKLKKIVPKIMAIAKPSDIDDEQQAYIAYVLKDVFSNPKIKISEFASVKKEEFKQIILDKYNECFIMKENLEDISAYVIKIIDVILDNIDCIESPESVSKTALKIVADHEQRLSKIENSDSCNNQQIVDDNQIFTNKYTGSPAAELFLDKGERKIYLNDVYVSPIIKGKDTDIDLYTQLNEWRKKPDPTREYTDADAEILLLYGKAGIGKSSLVAKLISDNYFQDNAHAIILNKKAELLDHEDPWGSIKRIYGCENDICYNNKVLILDGFDEVCVLKSNEFKGHIFLKKLSKTIPSTIFVKILITSRKAKRKYNNPVCWLA